MVWVHQAFARAHASAAAAASRSSRWALGATRSSRQALYEFEKERWRRGETESRPLDRGIYPP